MRSTKDARAHYHQMPPRLCFDEAAKTSAMAGPKAAWLAVTTYQQVRPNLQNEARLLFYNVIIYSYNSPRWR